MAEKAAKISEMAKKALKKKFFMGAPSKVGKGRKT
jgi:hypothetical protein